MNGNARSDNKISTKQVEKKRYGRKEKKKGEMDEETEQEYEKEEEDKL